MAVWFWFGYRPLWISPRQVCLVPVALPFNDYAQEVAKELRDMGYMADANLDNKTLKKKVSHHYSLHPS